MVLLFLWLLLTVSPVQAQAACTFPAQILNLTDWKETLPTGSSGSPTEIKQPALATFTVDPYFKVNATCDGVQFRAPTDGVTTSESSYPRSELREMANSGTAQASWSRTSGYHSMYIDQTITAIPQGKQHIVAGQIHDGGNDVIVVRLEGNHLFSDHNGVSGPTLDSNYVIGTRFNVRFEVINGTINLYYNGQLKDSYVPSTTSGYFFKAGAYTQSNCSTESSNGATCGPANYGEVIIYNVSVDHQTGNVPIPTLIAAGAPTSTATPFPTVTPQATITPATVYPPVPTSLVCDQCGYCIGDSIPGDYAACVSCIYGANGNGSVPDTQLSLPTRPGFLWTVAGCVETNIGGFTNQSVRFFVGVVSGITFLIMLYGGFLILTSQGDSQKLYIGKKLLTSAVIAEFIVLFATFLFNQAGGTVLKIPGIG